MTTTLNTMNIRGKDLYVEIHGEEDSYPCCTYIFTKEGIYCSNRIE